MTKDERSKLAYEKHKYIEANYANEIKACVENTIEYDNTLQPIQSNNKPIFLVTENDTVTEAFNQNEGKLCVMNFASYTNPGGNYLGGSTAQEEAVCGQSILYEVLSRKENWYQYNAKHKNRGLYEDRCLYSKDLRFFLNDDTKLADVITIPAPNYSVLKYNPKAFKKSDNTSVLFSRMQLLKNVCETNKVNTLIAGAWGCGVFAQDPLEVARIFKKVFETTTIKKIIFAIPGGRNFNSFKSIFK